MIRTLLTAGMFAVAAIPASANEAQDQYVESNLLSILYHELAHAIIDLAGVPIFGQEEDAADVASILLIDALYEEETAVQIAYDSAFGFLAEADATADDPAYWDVHGPDLQRYYNLVCLFAGANLEEREDVAQDLDLPEERLDSCEEEFELANDSWGPIFDELGQSAPGQSMRYVGGTTSLTERVVAQEIAALNEDFVLPQTLTVTVESCGEANAFYDPNDVSVTICTEFEGWLREGAPE